MVTREVGRTSQNIHEFEAHSGDYVTKIRGYLGVLPFSAVDHHKSDRLLVRHERIVNNDATISFKGDIYEAPPAYIRHRIEIRHPVDDPQELYLYDNGVRVGRIKLVDKNENARTFRPKTVPNTLSFHKGRVLP
ncbi:MAG: hypothetical protein D4R73_06165 [Deltaproteobacteria bacterium]|nr:MAG: hypothetical protein D4R73_06165 [Deltaproteobacteria bacterium]